MSSDVARGVYSSKHSKSSDSKRNLHNSSDPVLSTTVTLTAIDKYAQRNHSSKSLKGTKEKDRPNGKNANGKKRKDKKAEAQLMRHDEKRVAAAVMAAEAEILETQGESGERQRFTIIIIPTLYIFYPHRRVRLHRNRIRNGTYPQAQTSLFKTPPSRTNLRADLRPQPDRLRALQRLL